MPGCGYFSQNCYGGKEFGKLPLAPCTRLLLLSQTIDIPSCDCNPCHTSLPRHEVLTCTADRRAFGQLVTSGGPEMVASRLAILPALPGSAGALTRQTANAIAGQTRYLYMTVSVYLAIW